MSYIGRSTDGFGVRDSFYYVVSAGATSVSGADADGRILKFSDGKYVDVYLNGILLKPTDYTAGSNAISGISAMTANDEITVIVYDVFAVSDTVSATSGGTFSGNVELASTDAGATAEPTLTLYRNSASPADWDLLGEIQFKGENSASEVIEYATLVAQTVDVTDGTEDGRLVIQQQKAGTLTDTYIFDHDKFQFNDEQKIQWKNHGGTSYEVDLVAGTPTANRTITLPNTTGTVITTGNTSDITSVGTLTSLATSGDVQIGDGADKLGINTDDPHSFLDVSVQGFDSGRRFGVGYNDSMVSIYAHAGTGGLEDLSVRGDNLKFFTDYDAGNPDGVERMRIDSTGRVSIGTDGNMDRTRLVTQRTTGVGSSYTVIATVSTVSTFGGHYFITGRNASDSAARFCDQLVVGLNGSVVVLHSSTIRGGPHSRTYDNGGENLRVKMGGGSYTIQVFCVDSLTN